MSHRLVTRANMELSKRLVRSVLSVLEDSEFLLEPSFYDPITRRFCRVCVESEFVKALDEEGNVIARVRVEAVPIISTEGDQEKAVCCHRGCLEPAEVTSFYKRFDGEMHPARMCGQHAYADDQLGFPLALVIQSIDLQGALAYTFGDRKEPPGPILWREGQPKPTGVS